MSRTVPDDLQPFGLAGRDDTHPCIPGHYERGIHESAIYLTRKRRLGEAGTNGRCNLVD